MTTTLQSRVEFCSISNNAVAETVPGKSSGIHQQGLTEQRGYRAALKKHQVNL